MPLAIDMFCGLGGWTEGLLAEGYYVVGFDIERHAYGDHRYPAQLVIQDVLTLHGSQFKGASLIVASPPCQEFSYMAMPWSRAKEKARKLREGPPEDRIRLTALFDACFRIQREAIEAAGRHIPLVVENVRGANEWVGRSRWNFGSFHLWGDVPALMPKAQPRWCFEEDDREQYEARSLVQTRLTLGKDSERPYNGGEGVKHNGSGAIWFDTGPASLSSKSPKRKAASALIAKIPLVLARHIAATWHPGRNSTNPPLQTIDLAEGHNFLITHDFPE